MFISFVTRTEDVIEGNSDRFNLGLVFNELALEVVAVGVAPFAGDELPVGPFSHVFHSCLEEHISALTVFLALLPQTRVDILVGVGHDTLTLAEAVRPVTVIHTDASIDHFTDPILLVVLPSTYILVLWCNTLLVWLGEVLISAFFRLADLKS